MKKISSLLYFLSFFVLSATHEPKWIDDWKVEYLSNGSYKVLDFSRSFNLSNDKRSFNKITLNYSYTCTSGNQFSKVNYVDDPGDSVYRWKSELRFNIPGNHKVAFPDKPELFEELPFFIGDDLKERMLKTKYFILLEEYSGKKYKLNLSSVDAISKKYINEVNACQNEYNAYIQKEVEEYDSYQKKQAVIKKENERLEKIRSEQYELERQDRIRLASEYAESQNRKDTLEKLTIILAICFIIYVARRFIKEFAISFENRKLNISDEIKKLNVSDKIKEAVDAKKKEKENERLDRIAKDAMVDESARIIVNEMASKKVNVDDIIICVDCSGKGCPKCSGRGWVIRK